MAECSASGVDVSYLRKPVSLGLSDVLLISNSLTSGTEEVRKALVHECRVILECKICTSLFRGLPNFLAHKRVYCSDRHGREHLVETSVGGHLDMADAEVDQPVPEKSLFIERMRDQLQTPTPVKLVKIELTNNAAYQVPVFEKDEVLAKPVDSILSLIGNCGPTAEGNILVMPEPDESDHQSEVENTNPTTANSKPVVEHKVNPGYNQMSNKDKHEYFCKEMSQFPFCDIENLACKKCGISYSRFIVLKRHMFKIHVGSKKFQCTECSAAFQKIWNTKRHMLQVHKMSRQEIEDYHKKNAPRAPKNTPGAPKNTPGAPKNTSGAPKNTPGAPKNTPGAPKNTPGAPKNTSVAPKKSPGRVVSTCSTRSRSNTPKASSYGKVTSDVTRSDKDGTEIEVKKLTLYKCTCSKLFGKKEAYDQHQKSCVGSSRHQRLAKSTLSHASSKPLDEQDYCGKSRKPKGDMCAVSKGQSPADTSHSGQAATSQQQSSCEIHNSYLTTSQKQKLQKIIDPRPSKMRCLQCNKRLNSRMSLEYHAIRHFRWTRFKCKLCSYAAFLQADVRIHLRRKHRQNRSKRMELDDFIIQLAADKNMPKKDGATVSLSHKTMETKGASRHSVGKSNKLKQEHQGDHKSIIPDSSKASMLANTVSAGSSSVSSKYNISTRRNRRQFDTRPYERSISSSSENSHSSESNNNEQKEGHVTHVEVKDALSQFEMDQCDGDDVILL